MQNATTYASTEAPTLRKNTFRKISPATKISRVVGTLVWIYTNSNFEWGFLRRKDAIGSRSSDIWRGKGQVYLK